MAAGTFDTPITVERKEVTLDPVYGTEIVSWAPLIGVGSPLVAVKFWAEVKPVMPSRSESVRQGLAQAREQVRLRLRWRNDIDSTMRVIVARDADDPSDTDDIYQIVAGPTDIDGRRNMIEMMLERFSSSGAAT